MATSKRIPWHVGLLLCVGMLAPGWITSWLTCHPETYKIGTFYGAVCVIVFAACGIYHRRSVNAKII